MTSDSSAEFRSKQSNGRSAAELDSVRSGIIAKVLSVLRLSVSERETEFCLARRAQFLHLSSFSIVFVSERASESMSALRIVAASLLCARSLPLPVSALFLSVSETFVSTICAHRNESALFATVASVHSSLQNQIPFSSHRQHKPKPKHKLSNAPPRHNSIKMDPIERAANIFAANCVAHSRHVLIRPGSDMRHIHRRTQRDDLNRAA